MIIHILFLAMLSSISWFFMQFSLQFVFVFLFKTLICFLISQTIFDFCIIISDTCCLLETGLVHSKFLGVQRQVRRCIDSLDAHFAHWHYWHLRQQQWSSTAVCHWPDYGFYFSCQKMLISGSPTMLVPTFGFQMYCCLGNGTIFLSGGWLCPYIYS